MTKQDYIREAEKRGIKEGKPFRCAYIPEYPPCKGGWIWDDFEVLENGSFASKTEIVDSTGKYYDFWIYSAGEWATPVEPFKSDLEKRVEAIEKILKITPSKS